MMEELKNIKEAAVRMALHCGKIQMESFRTQNIGIGTKSNVYDVVTKVDKACEDYLLTEIARLYPTHSVLGEETGQHLHANSDWAWVVDPLDGTNSYSQGLPIFCVSIGVTYKGEGVVGVVYAPYLDEPTAFLDYPSKRRMFKLLTQVARDLNKAILLSTHDIDHAKRFGDEAWMMDKRQLRCSSFKELIAEKPDFFLSEEEFFNLFLA